MNGFRKLELNTETFALCSKATRENSVDLLYFFWRKDLDFKSSSGWSCILYPTLVHSLYKVTWTCTPIQHAQVAPGWRYFKQDAFSNGSTGIEILKLTLSVLTLPQNC